MEKDLMTSWLCLALMRIGTRMATGFDQYFAEFGITQAQFRVLLAICENGGDEGIAPSVIADYLLIERATVTALTTRLVAQGLLARHPGENRRTFRLLLTEAGNKVLQQLIPRAVALADETMAGISSNEQHHFRALLETVEARLRVQE